MTDYLGITKSVTVVALVSLDATAPGSLAIGTAQGVVKRVVPGAWTDKPEVVAIGLKPGDRVVGATQAPESDDLVFITSNAQLLRFPAAAVRPQGLPAGGVAGVSLAAGASVIWFGSVALTEDSVVATVSTTSTALPGTDAGRAKVSALTEFPAKGRGTQGVRAHAFLKGEDGLTVAWAGVAPPHAVGADGAARTLPDWLSKRDGSGSPLDAEVVTIGGSAAAVDGTRGEA